MMHIIWRGWGIVAGLIGLAGLVFTQLVVDDALGKGYYEGHAWPKLVGSGVFAPAIWFVGRSLNGSPESEERKVNGARHTFFFVPMEYWAPLFIVIGVIVVCFSGKNR